MVNPAAGPTGGGRRRLTILGGTIQGLLRTRALRIVAGTALAAAALASFPASATATSGHATPTPGESLGTTGDSPAAACSAAVTRVGAGALLFDNAHQMGTRSDALSIADDIRASTARRLDRVTAVSVPPELRNLNNRWIDSQRRLAALYATTWVRIYDTIDATHTPAQRTALPKRLEKLVHAPDTLKSSGSAPRTRTARPRLHRRRHVRRRVCRQAFSGQEKRPEKAVSRVGSAGASDFEEDGAVSVSARSMES